MKTPVKVSVKVQRIAGALSRMLIQIVNHPLVYFWGIRPSLIFLTEGRGATFATPVRVYRNVIFPCISWEGPPLAFCPGKKYHVFGGKNTIFSNNTRKMMCQRGLFWKDHLFREFEENILFLCIFSKKIIFHFSPRVQNHIFGKKKYYLSR